MRNALQLYLSKPLTGAEYVAGKLAILLVLLLLVTWVPAMLLLVLQVLFAGNLEFLRANLFLLPAMTVFSFLYALLASFTMLALSSLSTSARYVAVLCASAVLLSDASLWDAQRGDPEHGQLLAVVPGELGPGRRRGVPDVAPLRHAVGRVARDDRREHWGLDLGA